MANAGAKSSLDSIDSSGTSNAPVNGDTSAFTILVPTSIIGSTTAFIISEV